MLIIEVALGIILAVVLLPFLPYLITAALGIAWIGWYVAAVAIVYDAVANTGKNGVYWPSVAVAFAMLIIPLLINHCFIEGKSFKSFLQSL